MYLYIFDVIVLINDMLRGKKKEKKKGKKERKKKVSIFRKSFFGPKTRKFHKM